MSQVRLVMNGLKGLTSSSFMRALCSLASPGVMVTGAISNVETPFYYFGKGEKEKFRVVYNSLYIYRTIDYSILNWIRRLVNFQQIKSI